MTQSYMPKNLGYYFTNHKNSREYPSSPSLLLFANNISGNKAMINDSNTNYNGELSPLANINNKDNKALIIPTSSSTMITIPNNNNTGCTDSTIPTARNNNNNNHKAISLCFSPNIDSYIPQSLLENCIPLNNDKTKNKLKSQLPTLTQKANSNDNVFLTQKFIQRQKQQSLPVNNMTPQNETGNNSNNNTTIQKNSLISNRQTSLINLDMLTKSSEANGNIQTNKEKSINMQKSVTKGRDISYLSDLNKPRDNKMLSTASPNQLGSPLIKPNISEHFTTEPSPKTNETILSRRIKERESFGNKYFEFCYLGQSQVNETPLPSDLEALAKFKSEGQISYSGSPIKIPKMIDSATLGYAAFVGWDEKKPDIAENFLNMSSSPKFDIVQSLKSRKNLMQPSGRKEVELLSKWLDKMLSMIHKERNMKLKDVFDYTQIIYTACLQEIIRQVTVHCNERGQLLQRIWNAYIEILDKGIIESNKERAFDEKEHLSHISSLHVMYQKKLDAYLKEINEQNKNMGLLEDKHIRLKDDIKYLKKKVKKLDKEGKKQARLIKDLEKNKARLTEMNDNLKLLLEEGINQKNIHDGIEYRIDTNMLINNNQENDLYITDKESIQNIHYAKNTNEIHNVDDDNEYEKRVSKMIGHHNDNHNSQISINNILLCKIHRPAFNKDNFIHNPNVVININKQRDVVLETNKNPNLAKMKSISKSNSLNNETRDNHDDCSFVLVDIAIDTADLYKFTHDNNLNNSTRQYIEHIPKSSKKTEKEVQTDDMRHAYSSTKYNQSLKPDHLNDTSIIIQNNAKPKQNKNKDINHLETLNNEIKNMTLEISVINTNGNTISDLPQSEDDKLSESGIYNNIHIHDDGKIVDDSTETKNQQKKKFSKEHKKKQNDQKNDPQVNLANKNVNFKHALESSKEGDHLTAGENDLENRKLSTIEIHSNEKQLHSSLKSSKAVKLKANNAKLAPSNVKKADKKSLKKANKKTSGSSSIIQNQPTSNHANIPPSQTTLANLDSKFSEEGSFIQEPILKFSFNHINPKIANVLETKSTLTRFETRELLREIIEEPERNLLEKLVDTIQVVNKAMDLDGVEMANLLKHVIDKNNELVQGVLKSKINSQETLTTIKDSKLEIETKISQIETLQNQIAEANEKIENLENEIKFLNKKIVLSKQKNQAYNQKLKELIASLTKGHPDKSSPTENQTEFIVGPTSATRERDNNIADANNIPTNHRNSKISIIDHNHLQLSNALSLTKDDSMQTITNRSNKPKNDDGEISKLTGVNLAVLETLSHFIQKSTEDDNETDENYWSDEEDSMIGLRAPNIISNDKRPQGKHLTFNPSLKTSIAVFSRVNHFKLFKRNNIIPYSHTIKKILRTYSVNAEAAANLLSKIQPINTRNVLPKLTVLKFISIIYLEKIKQFNGSRNQNPLYVFVYDYFINKYGLKKVAETKFIQMLESTLSYTTSLKINRFSRLLGLGEAYDNNEIEFYFNCFRVFDISGQGSLIASNLSETFYLPLELAEKGAIDLFEMKLDSQKLKELIHNIDSMKILDTTQKQSTYLIEFENLMDKIMETHVHIKEYVKGYVLDIFNAADLDNDEFISFLEFNILYKHLEREKYDKDEAKKLYYNECDLVLTDINNEKVMSFNKFTWICFEMKLFSEEKQIKFANEINPKEEIQNISELEMNIKQALNKIRLRLRKCGAYSHELKNIMIKLYNSIKHNTKPRKVLWMTYRLIDEESKTMLLEYFISKSYSLKNVQE